ncbi:MAG: hypothetical protein A2X49_00700 [Lentisphaerae bacterium GWF2_52_8]|nr:MAG: hypothetical protein A2X49_00700 [Lentisphaerae bacterium GWF2_52_8]
MRNEVGVLEPLRDNGPDFKRVAGFGVKVCQLVSWNPLLWTDEMAKTVRTRSKESGVKITSLWAGWPGGGAKWNFTEGPTTLGIVPVSTRKERVAALKAAADFAKKIKVAAIITHLGFIPENPNDPDFPGVVAAVREVAEYCKKLGLEFWFETGQETPVTLLRLIELVATGNLGINLDPANLILYGKGSPVDSLDVFGKYVRNIHAKDGLYPTNPMELGREVKVGEGRVRFPEFVRRLGEIGFSGEFVIEREIHEGEQQNKEIAETVEYLRKLIKEAK